MSSMFLNHIYPMAIPKGKYCDPAIGKSCPFLSWYRSGSESELVTMCSFSVWGINNEKNKKAYWTDDCKLVLRDKACRNLYPNGSKPFTPKPA